MSKNAVATNYSALPADVVAALANDIAPCELPEGIEQRLAARLSSAIAADAKPEIQVQRAADSRWIQVMPGVEIRILHHNSTTRALTSLWRLQPGAQLPAHQHDRSEEECLIIEGDICHADDEYLPGDYMIGQQGSVHGVISSKGGGVMMLRSSDHHVPPELLRASVTA